MKYTHSQSLHSGLEDYICVLKERLSDTNTKHTVLSQNSGIFVQKNDNLTKFTQSY